MNFLSLLSLIAPLLLELLKIFTRTDTSVEIKQKAAQEILDQIKEINAALAKAKDTDGDTSDLEKIINRRKS